MIGLGLGLPASAVKAFSPRVDSPIAWYKSTQGVTSVATVVSQWSDISGNANHLVQATAGIRPLVLPGLINGFPAIRFDGVDDFLKCTAFTLNQPETVLAVFKVNAFGTAGVHDIAWDGNTAGTMVLGSLLAAQTSISAGSAISNAAGVNAAYGYFTARYNGASSFFRNNGILLKSGNAGAGNAGGFTLGALGNNTRSMAIEFAEVQIYSTAISDSQIADIESYYKDKYGL